nr:hypothetical protein [Tanacetum cinerariifolium]
MSLCDVDASDVDRVYWVQILKSKEEGESVQIIKNAKGGKGKAKAGGTEEGGAKGKGKNGTAADGLGTFPVHM